MASTSTIAACSSADDEDTEEGELGGRFNREELFSGKWTNWYDRNVEPPKDLMGMLTRVGDFFTKKTNRASINGLFKLSAMRDWLLESNLYDTNPTAKVEKIDQANVECDSRAQQFRMIDGTCNDLSNKAMGAAHVRFGRNVPLDQTVPKDILAPSPREVSRKLLARPRGADGQPVVQEVPFLNLLALTWIQYMNHDWFSHGAIEKTDQTTADQLIEIPLAADDPFRQQGLASMYVRKTETLAPAVQGRAPSYYNEVTHWWDGSQLYGSSKAAADALRAKGAGGELLAELDLPGGYLPQDGGGLEQSGFIRNWWVGMTQMHTIWAREHNNIVKMLKERRPAGLQTEQDFYDKARMINAACMAKIHTIEWTPAILPNPSMNLGMHSNWYGLKTAVWGQTKSEWFAPGLLEGRPTNLEAVSFVDKFADFFGLSNPAINGLVGSRRDLGPNNVPFTLTEEFTSVYRLHSLLPENLVVRTAAGNKVIPTTETRKDGAGRLAKEYSLPTWISSFGLQKPGQLILNNFPAFLQDIDVPGFQKYDIGMLDILRDRERGVPRYNKFRELLQLKPLDSIEELCTDNEGKVNEANVRAIKEVYGGDINKVDLLVGTLAEAHRPEMFGFGETQFQIFILMASRRLMGDRFYSTDFKPEIYTQEGIDWIKQANFKNVIIRAYPELAPHLANVENAFLPWDGSAKTVPAFSTTNGKAVPVRYPR